MKRLLTIAATLLVLIAILSGCTPTPASSPEHISVSVVATRDFGAEFVFSGVAEVDEGASAQKALEQIAEVAMAGSYIEGIDGLYSGTEYYWLYYINGMLANVFASGYKLHPGDMQHWDFHDYSYSMHGSSAIVGNFPEPFLHGYGGGTRPTVVVCTENFKEEAQRIKNKLEELGVNEVSIRNAAMLSNDEKEHSNLILVGTMDFELVAEINEAYRGLALFAHFEDGEIEVLNARGRVEAEYGAGSGVIQATQNPWNPKGNWACENVVWMVSGTDESGVRRAVDALTGFCPEAQYAFAAVIVDEGIIKVPPTGEGGEPINWILIIVAAAVVVGAIVILVLRQRRAKA